jgi:hypothetical protein
LKFLSSIVILLLPIALLAQKSDSLKVEEEEVNKFLPTGIRVGTDLISLVRSRTDDSFSGYEFNAEVDFYRYYLVAEMGRWEREFKTDAEDYANSGNYFRAGIDVSFLKKDPDKNTFFFGARYGHGTFSEDFTVTTIDPVWGEMENTYSNDKVKANWGELVTGLRVKMFGIFWMGYTARYKFALSTNEPRGFVSHDVPGYGKTEKPSTWGFNYQVLFKIPVRKQK